MPWKAQGGGPWGGGGGGGNGGGPWGSSGGNNPFSGGGRGPQPPDIEEMLRRSQDKVKKFVPGGGGAKATKSSGYAKAGNKRQVGGVDGYYVLTAFCLLCGLAWSSVGTPTKALTTPTTIHTLPSRT